MAEIKIYSTPTCPYCIMAKDFFKKWNIPYVDVDVASDTASREEMIEKTGQMGVPVIDIDGEIIIGFDQNRISKKLDVK